MSDGIGERDVGGRLQVTLDRQSGAAVARAAKTERRIRAGCFYAQPLGRVAPERGSAFGRPRVAGWLARMLMAARFTAWLIRRCLVSGRFAFDIHSAISRFDEGGKL